MDGIRIDSAALLVKDPALPEVTDGAPSPFVDLDAVHDIYRGWRRIADGYPGDRALIGEVWLPDRERFANYLRPDELHSAFNFDFLGCAWDAAALRRCVDDTLAAHAPVGAPATWVLSNHDVTRHVTRYGRDDTTFSFATKREGVPTDLELGTVRARAAALLSLALPGAVYVYQGEELGLWEVEDIPVELRQDPMWNRSGHGRDGCRVPLPWAGDAPPFGFNPDGAAGAPWLPQPAEWKDRTVRAQTDDPHSMLELYRTAIGVRRAEPGLGDGEMRWLGSPDGVLAFTRGAAFVCLVNLGATPVPLPAHETRLLASGPLEEISSARHRRLAAHRRHTARPIGRRTSRSETPFHGGPGLLTKRRATRMAHHTTGTTVAPTGRPARAVLAAFAGAALVATAVSVVSFSTATPARAAGLSPFDIVGRGATVPFVEHEAEKAAHTGTKIGPTRYYGQLPSEASGREAVTLDAVGEYVEFTLTAPANAVTFRYSLPDNAAGTGRDASIDLRANGSLVKAVPVTSRYGWYYGGYPFNNNPGDTNPHHFYDESRTMFGTTYPAGTKIRLQVSSTAQSPTFTIDLADFELVTAIAKPAGVLDVVTDFGADASGATDSTAKFQAAVDAGRAQGRAVWIPAGTFTLWDHVVVDGVTLRGAGPWYSVLGGRHPTDRKRAAGIYGKYVPGGGYTGRSGRTRPAAPAATSPCATSRSSGTSGSGSTTTRSTPWAAR